MIITLIPFYLLREDNKSLVNRIYHNYHYIKYGKHILCTVSTRMVLTNSTTRAGRKHNGIIWQNENHSW